MVHNTYGDEVGVQYAESILNFSRNCDYAMSIVDHLLDILTGNEHRKTSRYIEEMKMLRKEDEVMDRELKNVKPAAAAGRAEEGKSGMNCIKQVFPENRFSVRKKVFGKIYSLENTEFPIQWCREVFGFFW